MHCTVFVLQLLQPPCRAAAAATTWGLSRWGRGASVAQAVGQPSAGSAISSVKLKKLKFKNTWLNKFLKLKKL